MIETQNPPIKITRIESRIDNVQPISITTIIVTVKMTHKLLS